MLEEGFESIDFIFARKLLPEGPPEGEFFLAYLLKSAREGHLCVDLEHEERRVVEGAGRIPPNLFEKALVRDKNRIYLRRNWECESAFLSHLKRLRGQSPKIPISSPLLREHLRDEKLNTQQAQAIEHVATHSVSLITGGPGTGKTYTAAVLIKVFKELGIKHTAIAAPTGKATANIRASLGPLAESCTFNTLHALVQKKKLYADLIVVDEGSMVDAERMQGLFSAVQEGARLVLLGDKDQLPPVESGNFFADLAKDPSLVSELTVCLRAELQEIIERSQRVKSGISIPAQSLPPLKELIPLLAEGSAHILTPLRRGLYGVEHLNQLLYQEHQKKGKVEVPIMITVNTPSLNLFNGDVGTLLPQEGVAYFSAGRKIPAPLLPRYEYAYVMSVHKSQGSEYDRLIVLLPQGSEAFGREMLYTAITRAKKEVTIFAHAGVMEQVVNNRFHRRSGIQI